MKNLLLALCLAASAPILGAAPTITLGVSGRPVDGVVKHLNASGEVAVEVREFRTDDDLYSALRSGTVDLVFLGAVRYVQAHSELGAIPLVAEGKASRSMIAVPVASPLKKVSELRGKRIAFGYAESTSTYLIPLLVLSKNGLKAEDVAGTFVSHKPQDLVDQTLGGKHDACAISEATFAANKNRLRVLEASEPFAGPPLVARKGLDPAVTSTIRRLMTSYRAPAGDPSQRFADGVLPVTDADYNRIRFLCKVVLNKTYR